MLWCSKKRHCFNVNVASIACNGKLCRKVNINPTMDNEEDVAERSRKNHPKLRVLKWKSEGLKNSSYLNGGKRTTLNAIESFSCDELSKW